jgi:hypothetical protein
MSTPTTPAAGANAPAAPKPPVNTEYEPELDSLPEDLPPAAQATPEAPRQAGAASAAATPAPAAPTPPAHDPQLVRIAKLLGLGDDDIAERNTEELHRTVNLLNRQRLAAIERETAAPARPAAAPERPAPPPEPTFETEMLPKLEGFPPEMIEALGSSVRAGGQAAPRGQQEARRVRAPREGAGRATVHEAIDAGFAGMGAEYAELVGTGTYDEATAEQKFFRDAIVQHVNAQPKTLTRPREIAAAITAAGKQFLAKMAKPPTPAAAAQTVGNYGGAGDDEVPTGTTSTSRCATPTAPSARGRRPSSTKRSSGTTRSPRRRRPAGRSRAARPRTSRGRRRPCGPPRRCCSR